MLSSRLLRGLKAFHALPCLSSTTTLIESSAISKVIQRTASSSSSTRWKTRQGRDSFSREAKVQGLKSRAAFKLLELDAKYKIFKKGQTVVDLGYAPGSWSQVAVERTKPFGRIIGIDIIPAQPPKGVSTIQGNFLSLEVQAEIKRFLTDPSIGRPDIDVEVFETDVADSDDKIVILPDPISSVERVVEKATEEEAQEEQRFSMVRKKDRKKDEGMVDIVLSDMCAPWPQTTGFWKRSLSDPYLRMMNTSGIPFRDHAGSMDLCNAALRFSHETLKHGGHFICKFYQGSEDRQLEAKLKKLFAAVHREKPESSRSESKEAFFVALRRKRGVELDSIFPPLDTYDFPE